MNINYSPLGSRVHIIAMNYLNNYIYAFTIDGDFYEFQVDYDKKEIKLCSKKNMDDFLNWHPSKYDI